jgi:hypothetical protein
MLLLVASITDDKNWPLLGMAGLALAYIVIRPMLRKKRDPLDRPSGFKSLSQQRSVERSMQNLLVDLSEMARQISGQLDTRAAKLEALIREADEKIEQLRSVGTSPPTAAQDQAPRMRLVGSEVSADQPAPEPSPPDRRHAEVYALADEGRPPREIAARLNRPSGEIELILALRPHGS